MKAQITVFIIIGVLVLIAFGITLYVGVTINKTTTKQSTQQIEQLETQKIQDYITTCLNIATIDALELLGQQGGIIYQSQGGITLDETPENLEKTYIQYDNKNIKFLITEAKGNVGNLFYSQTPKYPYSTFPIPPGKTEPYFNGLYGISQLPPLYNQTPEKQPVTGSIQETLEKYITKKTTE